MIQECITLMANKYSVYVIELDKEVLEESRFRKENPDYNPSKPCVYVGQTAHTPEKRFVQHLTGGRSSNKYVYKYGVRLRPKRYERYNPMATREEAEAREELLARQLQKKGYGVWWR